eukprot:TRINITY_DN31149_c0_g1_i3.p1 TRINITY_DN31149_c0_g1~~TRINITY_DN31149_c0_g1_i3.p1  ORF type:complete len:293 (+),score=29.88 TRINITY_DN31149_c0_g1_i3:52-879(+)
MLAGCCQLVALATSLFFVSEASGKSQERPLAPPPPRDIRCVSGPIVNTISASCTAAVETTDEIDFGVALLDDPKDWAYVHYKATVDEKGLARAVIPGLSAGQVYKVRGRAHWKGTSESWNERWSAVSTDFFVCTAAGHGEADDALANRSAEEERRLMQKKTKWIEVFRFRGSGYSSRRRRIEDFNLPDYLDNHNTGDANKQLSRWQFPGINPAKDYSKVSYTRYCVEILDAKLTVPLHAVGISTRRKMSSFAMYLACDVGECHCPRRILFCTLCA